jgi:transposase
VVLIQPTGSGERSRALIIIGVDYHPEFQQLASVNTETGEFTEARLQNREPAEQFYRGLARQGAQVRIGMEASGHARSLERLFEELQFDLWIGDAAQICSKRVRKQKTDRQDAQLILQLVVEDRFPGIWVPEFGEPRSETTALASSPPGADQDASDESVASGGAQ